uniref:Uncharacterized protein n=1 Tax=Anguilla anguilla TaxID=7936 RepID=A0A0E9UI35_ANGAN
MSVNYKLKKRFGG